MSKVARIVFIVVGAIIAIVLIGGYVVFHNLTRGPLPEHDGELVVAGLIDQVEILRDKWGIPPIYARRSISL